ncbi:hypothetical protein SAMN05421748_117177 [Paractinoplanes atraurantiacus]|uniref:Uncharacterized protein n=1 Tax=Paractinoplanes atraurantiacus TaxID=1036182 RepID=A0A285JBG3_9ACTN|nr:hypothetical protein SAMN05421748_117177 [Actinoplanes atraurantiacus]
MPHNLSLEHVEELLVTRFVFPSRAFGLLRGTWSFGNPSAHAKMLEPIFVLLREVTRSDDSPFAAPHLLDALLKSSRSTNA